jgi:hypothetical protein
VTGPTEDQADACALIVVKEYLLSIGGQRIE